MWALRLARAATIGVVLAAGSMGANASLGTAVANRVPAVRADADRGLLQVTMQTAVSRPAERYEVLIGTPADSDRATLASMSLVAGVWPTATLELVRGTTGQPFVSSMFDARTRPRIVRASLPGPLTDAALRAKIDLLVRAVNARPIGDSLSLSRIVGLADGYASCAPFEEAATRMAASVSLDDARRLGEPAAAAPVIFDVTQTPLSMDLPTPATPLCSVADHLTRSTALPSLPSGEFTDERFMRVVRTVRFALPRRVSPQGPPSAIGLLLGDAPLAARFDAPVLTLDGDAYAPTIVAGDHPLERAAENVRSTSSGCSDDARLFPIAVADAAGRAERLAALLHATADPRPVAVAAGPPRSCVPAEVVDRRVAVAFRVTLPHSTGTPSSETSPDDRDVGLLATKMMLPRIVAATPSLSSEARRELARPAETIRVAFDVSPDHAHGFRPISTALVPKLAADLGVPIDALDVSFVPPSLRVVARLANRGAPSAAAVLAALRDVTAVGEGEVRTLTERHDCIADADLLARDTIRAALAGVPASHVKDVLAIELHGPYVVEGSCRADDAGKETSGLGPDPRVRLAAYARVAYR